MPPIIHKILETSEVWALLIPLVFWPARKSAFKYLRPVKWFILFALFINTLIVLIYYFRKEWTAPYFLESNNYLYNLQSVVRFFCFTLFFILLPQRSLRLVKIGLTLAFVIFLVINFTFFEDFMYSESFSGRVLAIEVSLLLLFCMLYYFEILNDHPAKTEETIHRPPSFWIVTGLSIYVVINFPIFLFYRAMLNQFVNFAVGIWDLHNISFIIFCIFLARAFYVARKTNPKPKIV
jgi:hypothetical protein